MQPFNDVQLAHNIGRPILSGCQAAGYSTEPPSTYLSKLILMEISYIDWIFKDYSMEPRWDPPTPTPPISSLLFRPNSQIPEYPDNPIFVLIRAAEKRNIDIAQSSRKWVFSPQTEKKIIHYSMVIELTL